MEWGFGIARTHDHARDIREPFEALCRAATAVAGVRFVPHLTSSYGELVKGLEDGVIGLAWLPPIPALDVVTRNVAPPLAIPARLGSTSYLAAFIVRQRGPRSLDQLRGRRVAWVQRDSAAGYLVPRMHLAAEGFDVLRFFSRELFVHGHGAVVDAVVNGDADVGATFCRTDASGKVIAGAWLDETGHATRPVDALATVGPIPNDGLFASSELPAAARSALTRWTLGLDREADARELFRRVLDTSEFRVPTPEHFDKLRHMLRAARARGGIR